MISANPPPTVIWYKGACPVNYPIEDPDIVIFTHPDEVGKHTLTSVTFHKPNYSHCGKYECVAENEYGVARYEHVCNFMTEDEFYEWKAAEIKEKEKIHSLGKPSKMEQKLAAKAQKKMPEVFKPVILTEEELKVKRSDVYYKHIYEAFKRKEDEAAEIESHKEPELLPYNTDAEFITKPFCVLTHLLNHTGLEGRNIRLTWVVKAFDSLEANWLKDGNLMQFGKRIMSEVTDDGRVTLEIYGAKVSDSGRYRCTVLSKKYGKVTQECTVTVFKIESTEQPPKFTRPMRGIFVIERTLLGFIEVFIHLK